MAACGRCWVCGRKLDCNPDCSCGACVTELRERGQQAEHPMVITNRTNGDLIVRPGMGQTIICRGCERDIQSGAVAALLGALRAQRGELRKRVEAAERIPK